MTVVSLNDKIDPLIEEQKKRDAELNKEKDELAEALADLKDVDPQLHEGIRLFWNALKKMQKEMLYFISVRDVKNAVNAGKEYVKRNKKLRADDHYDVLMNLLLENAPEIEQALNAFGITKTRFDQQVKKAPASLLMEVDIISKNMSQTITERLRDGQNASQANIRRWREKYDISETDDKINELSLFIRAMDDAGYAKFPEVKAVIQAESRYIEQLDLKDRLVAVNFYKDLLWAAILAPQGSLLKEVREQIDDQKHNLEDKKIEIKEIDEKAKLAQGRLDSITDTIKSNEDLHKSSQNLLEAQISSLQRQEQAAQLRLDKVLKDLEAASQKYQNYLINHEIKDSKKDIPPVEDGSEVADGKAGKAGKAQNKGKIKENAESAGPKETAKPVSKEFETKMLKEYYHSSDGRWVKRVAEKNGSHIVMTKYAKFGGRISRLEFDRLKVNNMLGDKVKTQDVQTEIEEEFQEPIDDEL